MVLETPKAVGARRTFSVIRVYELRSARRLCRVRTAIAHLRAVGREPAQAVSEWGDRVKRPLWQVGRLVDERVVLAGDKRVAGLPFCHLTRSWNQDGDFLQDPKENA